GSAFVADVMHGDPIWTTGQHTFVEVRRNLARLLHSEGLTRSRASFLEDGHTINVVVLDDTLLEVASTIAETTLARSLDALHLAAATRLGAAGLTFLTFDKRQADAARQLGFSVIGTYSG
ncbi:MAG: type II toxin-antitoxin system VapC family toxin, partial [Clostridia bacterium]|nr:type II toxin-antitoxin system VapC family toxin [Deltaproteobacteria bacterium]